MANFLCELDTPRALGPAQEQPDSIISPGDLTAQLAATLLRLPAAFRVPPSSTPAAGQHHWGDDPTASLASAPLLHQAGRRPTGTPQGFRPQPRPLPAADDDLRYAPYQLLNSRQLVAAAGGSLAAAAPSSSAAAGLQLSQQRQEHKQPRSSLASFGHQGHSLGFSDIDEWPGANIGPSGQRPTPDAPPEEWTPEAAPNCSDSGAAARWQVGPPAPVGAWRRPGLGRPLSHIPCAGNQGFCLL
jgi:hypothetical protein